MGKAKKLKVSVNKTKVPLDYQIGIEKIPKPSTRIKLRERKDEDDEQLVDEKLTKKILNQARKQQEDLEEEFGISKPKNKPSEKFTILGATQHEESDDDQFSESEDNYFDDIEINEEDEKALERFMSQEPAARRTLADLIKEKLTEKETEMHTMFSDAGSVNVVDLDEKIVEMYKGVKQVLAHYRSGKLPKAFKIIPSLSNWEQILYLTDPDNWTAAAMYQATRIFASNLKEKMAQRFYSLILLPRVRDDIAEFKKLNFHLYQALRKALFKPGAFFKGIILPLCESGTCTLQEAVIIGSVLSKNSVPLLHSAAALIKIAEMDYNGANTIFMRILLDKKYALPYKVIDAVVNHFLRFTHDKRELPVLWHQCLLTFAQRYKTEISSEQKEALLELLKIQSHYLITPEIRREYQHSKCLDEIADEPML
ncbi:bystin [Centruroides vittatus]|uniref:bystin n=1 Tax=Centruroides vittatus TaxID=120091 RepID=UPI00350FCFE8